MKKIFSILIAIAIVLNLKINDIDAANGSVSLSKSSMSCVCGYTYSFTIHANNAAGKVKIYSTNTSIAKVDTPSVFLDNSSAVINVTAIRNGSCSIIVELVDVTAYPENDNDNPVPITGTRTVKVEVYTPVAKKSSDTSLKRLEVKGLEIEKDDEGNMFVYAPKGTTEIEIDAETTNGAAEISSINGSVVEGWNDIGFTVTAEDGNKESYLLKVYVEETPTITFNKDLGVVKNLHNVEIPEGFVEEKITINEEEVSVFKYEKLNLIYLVNSEDEKSFYLYDLSENKIIEKYELIIIDGKKFLSAKFDYEEYPRMDIDFHRTTTTINDKTFDCWDYDAANMADYHIIVLKDEKGDKKLFCYDSQEKTIQRFTLPEVEIVPQQNNSKLYMVLGLSAGIAGFIAFVSVLIASTRKKK